MARIVWACWDGGGNLPPSLEIAHALTKRGHDVRFIGRPEMVGRAADAGVTATAFRHARTDLDRYSFHPKPALFGYTSSPAVGEELAGIVEAERPDVVVIDAVIATALNVVPQFGRPTVAMLHTLCYQLLEQWRAYFAMQSQSRQQAGFDAMPSLDEGSGTQWRQSSPTIASLPAHGSCHRTSAPAMAPAWPPTRSRRCWPATATGTTCRPARRQRPRPPRPEPINHPSLPATPPSRTARSRCLFPPHRLLRRASRHLTRSCWLGGHPAHAGHGGCGSHSQADGGLVLDQGSAPERAAGRAWPGVSGAAVFCKGPLAVRLRRPKSPHLGDPR
jgi:hypothetical protein